MDIQDEQSAPPREGQEAALFIARTLPYFASHLLQQNIAFRDFQGKKLEQRVLHHSGIFRRQMNRSLILIGTKEPVSKNFQSNYLFSIFSRGFTLSLMDVCSLGSHVSVVVKQKMSDKRRENLSCQLTSQRREPSDNPLTRLAFGENALYEVNICLCI